MTWRDFFTNEAISNYLVFAAGLIVGLVFHLVKYIFRKPNLVEVQKQKEISLLSLSEEAQKRLKVTYEHQTVNEFYQTLFAIRNKSDKEIEEVSLKLYLETNDAPQKLYEMKIEDPLEDLRAPKPEVKCVVEESGEHFLRIFIPYLNSYGRNKDEIVLKVYSPKPIKITRLVGGGKGWNSKFFDRVVYNEKLDKLIRESSSTFDLLLNATAAGILKRR